jgi:type VI secretion system (T6SS) effector Hcp
MVTAPSEIFLKLDGIPGESTDSKHKNEIDVVSYDESVNRMGVSTARQERQARRPVGPGRVGREGEPRDLTAPGGASWGCRGRRRRRFQLA